jgi:choline dehydrogenase-like flavoprotein
LLRTTIPSSSLSVSGAGGGTLANELCQKGVKVVMLEAGKRESPATFINDEWALRSACLAG